MSLVKYYYVELPNGASLKSKAGLTLQFSERRDAKRYCRVRNIEDYTIGWVEMERAKWREGLLHVSHIEAHRWVAYKKED